jgi:hypothetical protein
MRSYDAAQNRLSSIGTSGPLGVNKDNVCDVCMLEMSEYRGVDMGSGLCLLFIQEPLV